MPRASTPAIVLMSTTFGPWNLTDCFCEWSGCISSITPAVVCCHWSQPITARPPASPGVDLVICDRPHALSAPVFLPPPPTRLLPLQAAEVTASHRVVVSSSHLNLQYLVDEFCKPRSVCYLSWMRITLTNNNHSSRNHQNVVTCSLEWQKVLSIDLQTLVGADNIHC